MLDHINKERQARIEVIKERKPAKAESKGNGKPTGGGTSQPASGQYDSALSSTPD